MGQKKRASATRTTTTLNATTHDWYTSPGSNEGHTGGVLAGCEPQQGTGLEMPSSFDGAGGESCISGKGHGGKASGIPNSNGKAPTNNGVGGVSFSSNGKDEALNSAGVRGECERALVALRRGNSTKALRLIRDACNRNENSGLAYRVQGHIFMRLASVIEDANTKQRYFSSALESAKKAASLSPNSVEYAHFYAQLLYEVAKDSKGYEEVVGECERALRIEDPVDPAKESLHNEQQQQELPTPEDRIAHVKQELRGLVQKANITSISTWMKTLGSGAGEEKLRFIQMRKFADQDPMEQRISQPKRPHEVKKVVKTPEERRKEIEVRVAAARLLQQSQTLSGNTGGESTEEPEKSLQKRLDRRKSTGPNSRRVAKTLSTEEKIDRVRQLWRVLSPEKRESLLEVSIVELKDHLASWKEAGGLVKSHAASDALSEALEFAQENKTWRFWACCKCGERFIEYQDLILHSMSMEHIGSLPQKLQQVIPREIDQEWVEHLLDKDCRPIDGAAAVKLLIEFAHIPLPDMELQTSETASAELENLKVLEKTNVGTVKGTDDVFLQRFKTLEAFEDIEAGGGVVHDEVDQKHLHTCNGDCQKVKNVAQAGKEMPSQDLPLVENEERKKLLEKIYVLFRVLIRNKCLARDHVLKIIQYATEEVQSLVPDPTVHYEFNQSPLYIRFLEALPLQHIHKYLIELAQACGLSRISDSIITPNPREIGEEEIIPDRLVLNEDFTQLLIDERVLKEFSEEIFPPSGKFEDVEAKEPVDEKGEASHKSPLPLMKKKEGGTVCDHMDLQLSWIYGSMEYEYQPSGWKQFREEQGQKGRDIFRALEKEFKQLHGLCDKKYELVSYEEALGLAEGLCAEENKRREYKGDGTRKSYETVLKQRQQELADARTNGLSPDRKLELDAITNVLRDAQTGMVRRHPYDGNLGVRVSDSDEDEDEAWRMQESPHRADSRVDNVILRQREQLSNEINHVDAKIMKTTDNLQKLEMKLGQAAVLDYRAVVLPLVKSFLKSRVEEEADKDAMQKSDAAQEAFLAELAKDRKSPGSKDIESSKQTRDKTKEKKKVKDHKKLKDLKRGSNNAGSEREQRSDGVSMTQEEVDEVDSWDWEGEDVRLQQEAEIRHQAEIWEEERKLAEQLELQRCAEEETKAKHLAEQERKKLAEIELQHHADEETKAKNLAEQEQKKIAEQLELQCRAEEEAKAKHLASQEQKKLAQQLALQNPENGCEVIRTSFTPIIIDKVRPKKVEVGAEEISSGVSLKLSGSSASSKVETTCIQKEVLGEVSHLPMKVSGSQLTSTSSKVCASEQKPPQVNVRGFGSEGPTLREPEQKQGKQTCEDSMERVRRVETLSPKSSQSSNGVLPSGVGDHLAVVQKKPRGSGNRSRRRRGPRIHAEEGMVVDQEAKTSGSSEGSKCLPCQNSSGDWKRNNSASASHEMFPLLLLPAPPLAEGTGDHEIKKTLRQLQAEQDDEDRFQADLEQAMRQSLDMLTTKSMSSTDIIPVVPSLLPVASTRGMHVGPRVQQLAKVGPSEVITPLVENQDVEELGKGLRNEIGQYNCFLNVVIQVKCRDLMGFLDTLPSLPALSLWHLRRFREELLADTSMQHMHIGNPCVVCALRDIFVGLKTAAHDHSSKDAVAPTALRVALSALYSDSDFFQEAQMNDASEVLAVIFDCLHKAFVPYSSSDGDSESSATAGSWDCQGEHPCMAHALFGLDVSEQMNCQGCGLESRHLKYTTFFHNINASALRNAKLIYQERKMHELLKLVNRNHQLACDVETKGCGQQNYIHHLLHAAPNVFTTVLGWQNGRESFEDISVTVDAIDVDMDIGVVYRGLDEGSRHRLVSVVCYYGQHYHCFAYNQELRKWVLFDDSTVKVIGEWSEVASTCRRGHLQPQVLFYEAEAVLAF